MSNVPDYALEETIDFKFTSRSFSTGVPTTLGGTPAVEIYEDNSVTQITAAETLTVDFDGVTGLNNLRVVATAANGFEAGKSYQAVISTGTVGGVQVVGEVVAQFSIQRSPVNWANVTAPTTAVDLSGTDIQLVDTATAVTNGVTASTVTDKTGYSISGTKTTLDALNDVSTAEVNTQADLALSDFFTSAATLVDLIWDEDLSPAHDTAGSSGKALQDAGAAGDPWGTAVPGDYGAGTAGFILGTNLDAVLSDIETDTAQIGAAGAGLTEAGGTGDHLTAINLPNQTMDIVGNITGNLSGSVGSVTGAVVLADSSSDAIIADAVWNAATVTYGGVGSYGEHVESLSAGGDATEAKQDSIIAAVITNAAGTDIAADIIAIKAETALIVADTGELQTDWVNDGRLDLLLDTAAAGDATAANQTTIISAIGTMTDLGGGADVANNLADIAGATFATATDSLESIRNRGDANWSASASSPLAIQSTTIATLTSQTVFTLTAGSADDDAYSGLSIVVTDSATSTQKSVGRIISYTGSTKTVTLQSDPGIFTVAVGDSVDIVAALSGATGAESNAVGWIG